MVESILRCRWSGEVSFMIGHADCNCHGLQKSGKTVDGIRMIEVSLTIQLQQQKIQVNKSFLVGRTCHFKKTIYLQ